uniref:Probable aminotransferase TAT2 n=1 Tax=Tanacetum cinerariifolium TaxID=118510 RepID=A0A6L2N8B2_TANCI|nr:probable aminotransferase TAT2 [Tanacetum cinerariifolium]
MGMKEWNFKGNKNLKIASAFSIKGVIDDVKTNLNPSDQRPVIPLSIGDPSLFPCFRTTQVAEDAVVDALRSAKFNGYAPKGGVLQARRSTKPVKSSMSRDGSILLYNPDVLREQFAGLVIQRGFSFNNFDDE